MREDIPTALTYETRVTNNSHGDRKGSLFLILGQSGIEDYEATIERFQDTQTNDRRSPHFVIGRDKGKLAKMVEIRKKSWFAGVDSRWKAHVNLNKYGVTICLCAKEGQPYTDYQYDVLNRLIANQMKNTLHNHNADQIVSHQDVRPWRHCGVGPQFEWYRLIQQGNASAWKSIAEATDPWHALHEFGYRGSKRAMVTAFQTRFMASTITGEMDSLTANFIMGCP
ncbi:MAG: N-acetylmuramoyl-L-alanine amidase [Pseudomonadota bacterium]|nr:N-acetylmuramoyl-L-alanine amidase [Pseudomonadota bacterium]